jgi:hypothetical protein
MPNPRLTLCAPNGELTIGTKKLVPQATRPVRDETAGSDVAAAPNLFVSQIK